MELIPFILIVAVTLGICWMADRGFTKVFRSAPQHKSGLSVRLNKHVGGAGIVVLVLGLLGVLAGVGKDWLLFGGGIVLMLVGLGLIVYYLTFGIYYDEDGFVLTTFGRRSVLYPYRDIRSQQLYSSYGHITVELHLSDGRAVQLQHGMTGRDQFLDHAFSRWLTQKGLSAADCPFHNPENSCWFPPLED